MTNPRILAAALLLSTSAAAETVPYPNPVLTEHGLVLFINDRAHPAYRPLDGVDQWLSGKGSHLRAAESVDWRAAPDAPKTRRTHHSSPNFSLPRIPSGNPACERAGNRPSFCDTGHKPDLWPLPSIPLPAAAWMLLTAVGGLVSVKLRKGKSNG